MSEFDEKKFNEFVESIGLVEELDKLARRFPPRPRPGAGAYPALPIEPIESKLPKTKKRKGAPTKRPDSLKQIEEVLARYDVTTRSLRYLMDRIAESTGLTYVNLDRNFKKDIRKIIARMKAGVKNT